MPSSPPIRLRRADRCDRCRRWLPAGSIVVRLPNYGNYTRCAACMAHRPAPSATSGDRA